MSKTYRYVFKIILITLLYSPIPFIIAKVYYNNNSTCDTKGSLFVLINSSILCVCLLIGFLALLLAYLLIRLFTAYIKLSPSEVIKKYLFSSIYVSIVFIAFCYVWLF